jgi:hypothetical protein
MIPNSESEQFNDSYFNTGFVGLLTILTGAFPNKQADRFSKDHKPESLLLTLCLGWLDIVS